MPLHADLEEELEVVRAIYGEDAVQATESPIGGVALRLCVDLQPRVEQGAALVSVSLAIDLPEDYPAAARPRVSVERSRGLGDAKLRTLMLAAESAITEHGGQDMCCVSQLLADVSDALDAANDTSECNICLLECGPGQEVIRTECDHIFHSVCIGRWAAIRFAESEAAAAESTSSARSERDALQRELAEAVVHETETGLRADGLQDLVAQRSRRLELERALMSSDGSENLEVDEDDEELEEGEEPPTLEQRVERVREAKAALQQAQTAARKAKGRSGELRKKLQLLEDSLAKEAAGRAFSALPCPVCRVPVKRTLLPADLAAAAGEADVADGRQGLPAADASISALPQELQQRVRRVQQEHEAILRRRRARDQALAAQEFSASTQAEVAPQVQALPAVVSRSARNGPDNTTSVTTAIGDQASQTTGPASHGARVRARGGPASSATPPESSQGTQSSQHNWNGGDTWAWGGQWSDNNWWGGSSGTGWDGDKGDWSGGVGSARGGGRGAPAQSSAGGSSAPRRRWGK